jgi:hypothetical protein
MKSFTLLKRDETKDTFTGRFFRWVFYALAFAFLIWPILFIAGIIIAVLVAILAIVFMLSIIALPFAILLRVLRLV